MSKCHIVGNLKSWLNYGRIGKQVALQKHCMTLMPILCDIGHSDTLLVAICLHNKVIHFLELSFVLFYKETNRSENYDI